MKLHYYRDPRGNFGDDLNAWMWPQLVPNLLDEDARTLLVGIGTLLNSDVPAAPMKAVLGSGVGYGALPVLDGKWHIYCLRGPLSATALGLSTQLAVTDAAMLVGTIAQHPSRRSGAVFMPHHDSLLRAELEGVDLAAACDEAGMRYLDPADPVPEVLNALAGAELVVAEAMHAAIVADAFRVPWVPVRLYGHVDEWKWTDWTSSLDMQFKTLSRVSLATGSVASLLTRAGQSAQFLSVDRVADLAVERLQECLQALREDAESGLLDGGTAAPHEADPVLVKTDGWAARVLTAATRIDQLVPASEPLVLVDENEWPTHGVLRGRPLHRLHERDGVDYGAPPNDREALVSLARHVAVGTRYLAFTWAAFWWLDHYRGLADDLKRHAELLRSDEDIVLFRLPDEWPLHHDETTTL